MKSQSGANDDEEVTFQFVGYQLGLGKTTIAAQIGLAETEFPGTGPEEEVTYTAIGAIYKFTKQTRVFGGLRTTEVDDEGGDAGDKTEATVISVGLRKDF